MGRRLSRFACALSIVACTWSVAPLVPGASADEATPRDQAEVTASTLRADVESYDGARPLSGFFIIGMVINAIVALAFIAWFRSEWRKTSKRKSAPPGK